MANKLRHIYAITHGMPVPATPAQFRSVVSNLTGTFPKLTQVNVIADTIMKRMGWTEELSTKFPTEAQYMATSMDLHTAINNIKFLNPTEPTNPTAAVIDAFVSTFDRKGAADKARIVHLFDKRRGVVVRTRIKIV